MDKKQLFELMELIYKLDIMGVNNMMVRNHFDRDGKKGLHKQKNWSKFMKEHTDILNKEFSKLGID